MKVSSPKLAIGTAVWRRFWKRASSYLSTNAVNTLACWSSCWKRWRSQSILSSQIIPQRSCRENGLLNKSWMNVMAACKSGCILWSRFWLLRTLALKSQQRWCLCWVWSTLGKPLTMVLILSEALTVFLQNLEIWQQCKESFEELAWRCATIR